MSEQDDADVIEQAPRQFNFTAVPGLPALRGIIGSGRRRLVVIAAACALLLTAAALVTLRLTEGLHANPGLAALVTEVTTVPVGTSVPGFPGLPASASSASAYSSTLPHHRRPPRLGLPSIPQERRAPLLKARS